MMAEPLAAALHGVAKHYHGFTLGPLNLEIPAGSIVGLIGENGAGKTTTLRTITGLEKAASGSVMFDGHDLRKAEPSKIITYKLAHVPEVHGSSKSSRAEPKL